ncbi:MAG: hypothetical protein IJB74_00190 [Clostridia bacterium]|nr:hypothetical protein [Clostridia bacterium]
MMPKPMIKGICIFLAALMVLSVGAIIFQVIAAEPGAMAYIAPATGDNDADYIIPIGLGLLAVLAIGICVFLPKMRKKEDETK